MKRLLFVVLIALNLTTVWGATPGAIPFQPGKNSFQLRGQSQKIWFYPATGIIQHHAILFAPGDGGHRGFAVKIAEQLAAKGYDVYALDTRHYLASFTGKTPLTPEDVMRDFHTLAAQVHPKPGEPVTLVGWSTGAGLTVLAAASADKTDYDGLIAISLGKTNILGWRWVDNFSTLFSKSPHEPTFKTEDYAPKITPLPVFVIQSSKDEFIPNEDAEHVFISTHKPKHFRLIHANNHSFGGKREEFFEALQHGLHWVQRHQPARVTTQ